MVRPIPASVLQRVSYSDHVNIFTSRLERCFHRFHNSSRGDVELFFHQEAITFIKKMDTAAWRRYTRAKRGMRQWLETQKQFEDLREIAERKVDEDIAVMNLKAENKEKKKREEAEKEAKNQAEKEEITSGLEKRP